MKNILNQLFEHKPLDREQAKAVLQNMAMDVYNEAQIAAFITVYLMRSITEEELSGFRDAILKWLCQLIWDTMILWMSVVQVAMGKIRSTYRPFVLLSLPVLDTRW